MGSSRLDGGWRNGQLPLMRSFKLVPASRSTHQDTYVFDIDLRSQYKKKGSEREKECNTMAKGFLARQSSKSVPPQIPHPSSSSLSWFVSTRTGFVSSSPLLPSQCFSLRSTSFPASTRVPATQFCFHFRHRIVREQVFQTITGGDRFSLSHDDDCFYYFQQ